jgi:hypothetical protein
MTHNPNCECNKSLVIPHLNQEEGLLRRRVNMERLFSRRYTASSPYPFNASSVHV